MILTGKAKEDFSYKYNMSNFNEYSEVLQNSLIIDFFDSVDIYVYLETATYVLKPNFRYKIITDDDTIIGFKENSRQEATIQAIKRANNLYNENNSM